MIVMVHTNINTNPVKVAGVGRARMTRGEYRVGIHFNPSGNSYVNSIKIAAAALIDIIDGVQNPTNSPDIARWKAEAMTNIETGQMFGVKAATANPYPAPDEPALRKVPAVAEPGTPAAPGEEYTFTLPGVEVEDVPDGSPV